MSKKSFDLVKAGCVCAATALVFVPVLGPALAQDTGGVTTTFTFGQDVRVTRNPNLSVGNDDVRTVFNTDLRFSLSSVTRSSEFTATAGGRIRLPFGDVTDEGDLDFGREQITVNYVTRAPRARVTARLSYLRDDVSFLDTAELLTSDDGTLVVVDDLADLQGTGTRENITYRFGAQFDEEGPFGGGITLSGSDLNYSNVSNSALDDRETFNAILNAHLDVTPTVRLDGRVSYNQRETDTSAKASSTEYGLSVTAVRSERLTLRGAVSLTDPEFSADRTSISAGLTVEPTRVSTLSFDVGATFSDDFDTKLTGSLNYTVQPTSRSRLNVQAQSAVLDASDNDVVVSQLALVGFDYALNRLTSLSIDGTYSEEDNLTTGIETGNLTGSVQMTRQLNRDWQLSGGFTARSRKVTGASSASSEEVFLRIQRTWDGRF